MLQQWAYNSDKKLVFIDTVENGLKCNCTCIACGARMVAKNGGNKEIKEHHFAHESGHDCGRYRETILHIWSKEIIEEYKSLFIPSYNEEGSSWLYINDTAKVFATTEQKLQFASVDIEKRLDESRFIPDIVGVTDDGLLLWIEILVTHKCSAEKIEWIKNGGINCIEIKIPDDIETKDRLTEFLLDSAVPEYKRFINFPYGDSIILREKKKCYNELKTSYRHIPLEDCYKCFRATILQEKYEEVLSKYKERFSAKYQYVFKRPRLVDLVGRYPKLINLPSALVCQQFIGPHKGKITGVEIKFAEELSDLYDLFHRGSFDMYDCYCPYLYAFTMKTGKESVFCSNNDSTMA